QYTKLEEEKQQYVIKFSSLVDNDRQHRQKIDAREILYDKISRQLVEMNNNVFKLQEIISEKQMTISELKECVRNKIEKLKSVCRKEIGFKNPSYFCKAKELRPSLYDERVIGIEYTLMFLTHSNEALEIEKFKKARENKIEFAYDYGNLNASYQTSSLKPYVPTMILEKIIINLEDEVHVDTRCAYSCNDAMNVSCDSRLHASYDLNDMYVFDDPRTSLRLFPKMRPLAEPVAKWIPKLRIVQIYLWILDSRCSKHMTGNRTLLMNFMEKFLGMVGFGNDDFAVISG
ncbi:hypothetical protein Tco_0227778, partial [Tanacetum coccineum]